MDAVGQKLLDVARTQLGYTEKGDGYTKFGDWFAKNVDAQHDSYFVTAPWCDMFIAWAADKAGVAGSVGQFASTQEHAAWFQQQHAWGTKPQPGALVFYSWSGSKSISDIDHVGLVERVEGGTLHTIEGNTEGVHLMRQTRDTDAVVGYGYPAKVKVAGASSPVEQYVPRHAAPAPSLETILNDAPPAARTATKALSAGHHENGPLSGHEVALSGLAAVLLCGSLALAVGRTTAAKVPAPPAVRVRKRGRHHRTALPVSLPAEITAADLDAAEAGTVMMPALTLAAAAEAEDRAFWGKIAEFEDDQELAFWNDLHAAVGRPAETPGALGGAYVPDRSYAS
ncbi:CHAP domain-containing protein [Actinomadura scrupuli]|uniref:CHAP domain-containing protein n=1 Tax=Actinomadura scrupuli TaxID=559629 RepID=UPI003D98193D